MNPIKNDKGFTLAETMVSSLLMLLLSGALVLFVFAVDHLRYEFQANTYLTNKARLCIEGILWGIRDAGGAADREGMWEGSDPVIVNASHLQFTDVTGAVHDIELNGRNIERSIDGAAPVMVHDPDGPGVDDSTRHQTQLNFVPAAEDDVIEIQLTVGELNGGRWHYVTVSTNVAFRN